MSGMSTAGQSFLPGFEVGQAGEAVRVLRCLVRAYDMEAHMATVQPLSSGATYLHDVPVSLEVASLAEGERVLVMLMTEHNPGDAVVLCRYGG